MVSTLVAIQDERGIRMQEVAKKRKVYIDGKLFERIRLGDQDAFRELYEISYKPLYAFLLSYTLNREDAQDLLQDTFVQILKNCHLYREQGNPMAWMMKIAKNLYLMKWRTERKQDIVDIDNFTSQLLLEQIPAVEDKLLLEELFRNISREDRDIIIMHVIMGMRHREIADILNLPVGTVLSRYHRSMKLLRHHAVSAEERRA